MQQLRHTNVRTWLSKLPSPVTYCGPWDATIASRTAIQLYVSNELGPAFPPAVIIPCLLDFLLFLGLRQTQGLPSLTFIWAVSLQG